MRAALPFLLAALLMRAGAAAAADAPLGLAPGKPLMKHLAGAPRIVSGPPAPVTARINAALARLDARGRKSALECRDGLNERPDTPKTQDTGWTRKVEVTFAGPRFLSVLVNDDIYCGGPHPNTSDEALVFDLATGRPVDWRPLVPATLHAQTVTDSGADGATLGYFKATPAFLKLVGPLRTDCSVDIGDDLYIALWPDRRAGGLKVGLRGFPHVTQACEKDATLKPDQLRRLGFAPPLVDALSHPAS